MPEFTGIKILGDLFVGALKAIAPLLVCLLIMSSLAQTKEGHNGNMKTVVILYMFSTVMGAIVAVAGSFLFPLKITLADAVQQEAPKGVVEVLENLLLKIVANPIDALVKCKLSWCACLGCYSWNCIKKGNTRNKAECFLMHLMRYLRQYDGL